MALACVTGDRFLDTLYVSSGTGSLTHCEGCSHSFSSTLAPEIYIFATKQNIRAEVYKVNTTITLASLHFDLLPFACGSRGHKSVARSRLGKEASKQRTLRYRLVVFTLYTLVRLLCLVAGITLLWGQVP